MGERIRFLVASLLLCCGTLSALDNEPPRFALVIGNAAYEGDAALANSANDASDMAEALSSIGWKVTKLINGDRRTMNRTITEFRNQVAGSTNPTALLYYAGHGIQIGGTNYLIPVKALLETPDDVVNDGISLQTVLNAFDDARVSTSIVILDACRDNPFVKTNTRSLGGTRGLSVVNKSANVEGSAVLFATAPGDTAADGSGRNGVFTQALLKFVKTDISLQVLATKVTGEVKKVTGGKQTPYSSLSLSEEFFMVPASLRIPVKPTFAGDLPALTQPGLNTGIADSVTATKASLLIEKAVLSQNREEELDKKSWISTSGLIGWGTGVVGLGLALYAYSAAGQALDEYNAQTTQAGFDSSRSKAVTMNLLFNVGLISAGTGLTVGGLSAFFGPDTAEIDQKIQAVNQKIGLLGGS